MTNDNPFVSDKLRDPNFGPRLGKLANDAKAEREKRNLDRAFQEIVNNEFPEG